MRDAAGWAIKDQLVNVALWERSMVSLLRGIPRHEALGIDEARYLTLDANGRNGLMFAEYRDLPLPDACRMMREVQRHTLSTLNRLSRDDLQQPYSEYLPEEPGDDSGDPILRWVLSNTAAHDDEHREWTERLARTELF